MKTVTIDLGTLAYGQMQDISGRRCAMGQILHDEGVSVWNMFDEANRRFGKTGRVIVTSASDSLAHQLRCRKRRCPCRTATIAAGILKLRQAVAAINYKLRVKGYAEARARRAA